MINFFKEIVAVVKEKIHDVLLRVTFVKFDKCVECLNNAIAKEVLRVDGPSEAEPYDCVLGVIDLAKSGELTLYKTDCFGKKIKVSPSELKWMDTAFQYKRYYIKGIDFYRVASRLLPETFDE